MKTYIITSEVEVQVEEQDEESFLARYEIDEGMEFSFMLKENAELSIKPQ